MKKYLRMISFVRPHWKQLAVGALCMLFTTIFLNAPKVLLIPAIDRVIADKQISVPEPDKVPVFVLDWIGHLNSLTRPNLLNALIVAVVVFILLKSFTTYWQTYFMSDASHRVIRDMRSKLYGKLVNLPLSFYGRNRAGELVSRITYDTGIVRDAISEGLMDAILQPMELVVNIILLIAIQQIFDIPVAFVLILTVVMPLIVYPVLRLGKIMKKVSTKSQGAMADINASLYESMSGIRVVQAFGMESYEKNRFEKFNWQYYKNMMKLIARNLMVQPMTEIMMVICGCIVAWIGGMQVIEGQMSPGAFTSFAAALFSLSRPFKRLSRLHGINQTAMAAADRVFSVLDEKNDITEIENPIYIPKIESDLEYKNVSFGYSDNQLILKKISFKVKNGEVMALVGASGSGKTTLLNLLPRFYDPIEGEIEIDGKPIKNVAIKSLRNQIGIVTQETILFNDSVSANIAYGQSSINQDEIEKAAKVANAYDFVKSLPNGFHTIVGDRGFKLSGGEKQRIAIARAILKNPPILILDEATSALDTESEQLVQEAIHNAMQGRTVLVIAHRLSTIKDADHILVLKNGQIVEQGNHTELIRSDGVYKKLHEMQFRV